LHHPGAVVKSVAKSGGTQQPLLAQLLLSRGFC